jgi:YD repeat-containing protein
MHVVRFDVQNAENGHLIGRVNSNRWRVYPGIISPHLAIQKLVMEFELYHNDVAHINQATSFFGLVADPAAFIRTSPNIVGFRYDGAGQLMSITDDAGGEVSIGITEVIEDTWHRFKIEVVEGAILFYVNGVLRTTHPSPLAPNRLMYPSWYFASAGGGADTFETYLGAVRIGYEVVLP